MDDALAPFVGAADEYEPGDRFRLPEEYGIDDQKARVLGIEHYKISGGVEFLTSLRESGKEDCPVPLTVRGTQALDESRVRAGPKRS